MAKQSGLVGSHILKVTLDHIEPVIWRTFQIPISATLDDLHDVLQIVMGWENYHLYAFRAGKRTFSPVADDPEPLPTGRDEEALQTDVATGLRELAALIEHPEEQEERQAALTALLSGLGTAPPIFGTEDEDSALTLVGDVLKRARSKLTYTYDFGDQWDHTIVVERSNVPTNPEQPAICLDGAGACPPEDCGGPWGYGDVIGAIEDPDNPEFAETREWLDGWDIPFDPHRFDRDAVNRMLAQLVWGLALV